MDAHLLYQFRFIPVVALLWLATALLRRKGQPPLALKGLQRALRGSQPAHEPAIPLWRRLLALACVLTALALAML